MDLFSLSDGTSVNTFNASTSMGRKARSRGSAAVSLRPGGTCPTRERDRAAARFEALFRFQEEFIERSAATTFSRLPTSRTYNGVLQLDGMLYFATSLC